MAQILTSVPGGDDVDNGVPPSLEWQDESTHEFERRRRVLSVNERIDPIGAGWDPGNEKRGKEEECALRVSPGCVVHFVHPPSSSGSWSSLESWFQVLRHSAGVLGIIGIRLGRDGDGVSIASRTTISGRIGFATAT